MKAVVYAKRGSPDLIQIADVKEPVPRDDEVLIRVRAASLNPLDYHLKIVAPYLVRIPGRDVAGTVQSVGRKVTHFKPGDEVFGSGRGALAEYACASETKIVQKPSPVTFEQAASSPVAGYTALQGLRDKGRLQAGQNVLINGAAGGVGTFAVQIAKWMDARVTAVCSARNAEMARSLGADSVVDYTREDFTAGPQRYDLIFDLVSNHSLQEYARVLSPQGIHVGAGVLGLDQSMAGMLGGLLKAQLLSLFVKTKSVTFSARSNPQDLAILAELMATGNITPVIDQTYSLSEAPEALRYLAGKHVRGKLIIAL